MSVLTSRRRLASSDNSPRSRTTRCAPAWRSASPCSPRSTPITQAEPAPRAGLDAGDGILDDRASLGLRGQSRGRLPQHRRIGLAGQPEPRQIAAVDLGVEQFENPRAAQYRLGVSARREHRDADAGVAKGADELHGARVGLDLIVCEPGAEVPVLAVAQAAHRLRVGLVGLVTVWQFDAARCEETLDTVVAGLAVDVFAVVPFDVEGPECFAAGLCPCRQVLVEQALPRCRVRRCGVGDDAVHVEQDGFQRWLHGGMGLRWRSSPPGCSLIGGSSCVGAHANRPRRPSQIGGPGRRGHGLPTPAAIGPDRCAQPPYLDAFVDPEIDRCHFGDASSLIGGVCCGVNS